MEKFSKKLYCVDIEKVSPGTSVHNYLENADYKTDENRCIVITGTAGEKWPVDFNKLEKIYDLKDLGINSLDNMELEKPYTVFTKEPDPNMYIYAKQLEKDEDIQTSWGDTLHGHKGDWVAYSPDPQTGEPNINDRWVINEKIFEKTYQEYKIK